MSRKAPSPLLAQVAKEETHDPELEKKMKQMERIDNARLANVREVCEAMLMDDFLPTVIGPGVRGRLCDLFEEQDSHERWLSRDQFSARLTDVLGEAKRAPSTNELAVLMIPHHPEGASIA